MRRVLKFVAATLLIVALGTYGVDYALTARNQSFDYVTVDQVYTSTNKWKQVEWSRGARVSERCIDALFPHFGSRPCWYVRRHTMNVTNTD